MEEQRLVRKQLTGRMENLIAAVAGLPQVSMPLIEQDGCPLGISFLGTRGQDDQLLAAARVFGKG